MGLGHNTTAMDLTGKSYPPPTDSTPQWELLHPVVVGAVVEVSTGYGNNHSLTQGSISAVHGPVPQDWVQERR